MRNSIIPGKRWLWALLAGMLALGVMQAGRRPVVPAPVCRFIHLYEATERSQAPMSFWERVAFTMAWTSDGEKPNT
jgi:hypothetical protein